MAIRRRAVGLDIVLHFSAIGATQADDPANVAAVHERHAVEDFAEGRQRHHPALSVVDAVVDPEQRLVPGQFRSERQRHTVLVAVGFVLERIELDQHDLM